MTILGGIAFTASAADDKTQTTLSAATKNEQSQSGEELAEILVTARKRSEDLRDIPASIVAISDSTIVEAHMTQIDDIGALVSNLHIVQRNDNSPDVTLRGIGSFGVVQGVGFYVNDVQLFEGQIIRPSDIERIEVLKGPQGTLYGGANIGGAIKYITKEPTETMRNEATAEFGQYDSRNYQVILSGPLVDEKLAVRASFYDDNHNGYIYDTFRKEEYGETFDHGGRVTFLYKPGDSTKIHLYLTGDDFSTGAENLLYTPPVFVFGQRLLRSVLRTPAVVPDPSGRTSVRRQPPAHDEYVILLVVQSGSHRPGQEAHTHRRAAAKPGSPRPQSGNPPGIDR
jgi:outer membrane receptor protein involved in Fe transport